MCIGVLIIVLISSAFVKDKKVKVLFSTICKAYAKGWTNGQAKSVLTDIVGLIRAHGLCDCHNDWLNVYVTHLFSPCSSCPSKVDEVGGIHTHVKRQHIL